MKKNFVILLPILLILTGCLPLANFQKQQNSLDRSREQIHASEAQINDKGRAYVYGTGVALDQAVTQDPAVNVARNLNDKAQVILGPPAVDDAIEMQKIVEGLTSDLESERAKAAKRETKFMEDVEALTKGLARLEIEYQDKLAAAEQANAGNAAKAQKWDEYQRSTWYKRIFATLGIGGTIAGLIALVVFVPAVIPIFARILGWVVGRLPKLASAVGVASVKTFDGVVQGVGAVRTRLKIEETAGTQRSYTPAEVRALIDTELAKATDSSHKVLIESRRRALGTDPLL